MTETDNENYASTKDTYMTENKSSHFFVEVSYYDTRINTLQENIKHFLSLHSVN